MTEKQEESNQSVRTLRSALALAAHEPERALGELESGLTHARSQGDDRAILSLARHAAVLCHQLGFRERAVALYVEAQTVDHSDPYLGLAIGNLKSELRQREEALAEYARALELARDSGDTELMGILTKLVND